MFRFTLRDLLWATALVGFCLHVWIDRNARHRAYLERVREEVLERHDAQLLAQEAEQRATVAEALANRYADMTRRLQEEAFAREVAEATAETASPNSR
jgi:hypothetical protein